MFTNPDCDSEEQTPDRAVLTPPSQEVRIAELQVFGPVVSTKAAPSAQVAASGDPRP